ncbi:hypothetical protein A2526_00425 [candidate division WOR-1 bacterium RIFOXYD2_FULL_36_8]|uniref:Uncharacterized protein n=1 Tax=candidate division WOR-1 bacterium RIFOXYB2_FULL_36_35 TaxID=1802578 RepID=A0A1F4S612_UNCSA|nr:MAG: hypothetical protein A2230_02190 [candidate division WOR-1 bacterium RIFOXYA2_FULL_36_21]OGC15839.1 MAG: hypothetical protein A2290_05835 [candidate division WOR-1 bacterium RIFOXYB2_FULL_36_35]OGC15899.1 MAG: hypothetical protein A2282_04875 [candidate division WOR-1 bacterium RIFOXYA12_FULL_36_13]OGC41669.1 MAG: hypothetical protein A2526_00425 [candidate division WOR-1 bacterium RIFOXYD2_FULL_36_8]
MKPSIVKLIRNSDISLFYNRRGQSISPFHRMFSPALRLKVCGYDYVSKKRETLPVAKEFPSELFLLQPEHLVWLIKQIRSETPFFFLGYIFHLKKNHLVIDPIGMSNHREIADKFSFFQLNGRDSLDEKRLTGGGIVVQNRDGRISFKVGACSSTFDQHLSQDVRFERSLKVAAYLKKQLEAVGERCSKPAIDMEDLTAQFFFRG